MSDIITCQLCGRECSGYNGLASHVTKSHKTIKTKNYYDQFLKKEGEGICLTCGKETSFSGKLGYSKHCSYSCSRHDPEVNKKQKETCLKKYGTEFSSQSLVCRLKVKKAWKEKDILEYNEKRRNNHQQKYGVDNPFQRKEVQKKYNKTMIKNHGVEWPMQSKEIYEKSKKSCKESTGFEYSAQSLECREKQLKNTFRKKEYILPSGKIILLQGEEPNFLDYVFSNNLLKEDEINYKPKRIKYILEEKEHYYFPDFFISKLNLVVEIKSWYILSIQKNTDLKIDATKVFGHHYIMILDKKYDEFTNLIKEFK